MRILVTGASGTIGGYVLRELLRSGHTVSEYSRTRPGVDGVNFIQGDIMEPDQVGDACQGHDAIIHLAAIPGPGRATVAGMLSVNVVGAVHVLEGALQADIKKFVFASSGAATGFSFHKRKVIPRYLPLDEEHPCEPHDEYGLSKLLAEMTCKRYSDAYGMQTICLRINHNWYIDRDGAEGAVGRGWAKRLTIEELWDERYRSTIDDPDSPRPVPGPPPPVRILWAFTDARDMAQAFRLAVENEEIVHDIFLINGDDTCSAIETQVLISQHFPGVPLKSPLEGCASLWSHDKATQILGYRPQFTWREGEFRDWLEARRRESM